MTNIPRRCRLAKWLRLVRLVPLKPDPRLKVHLGKRKGQTKVWACPLKSYEDGYLPKRRRPKPITPTSPEPINRMELGSGLTMVKSVMPMKLSVKVK